MAALIWDADTQRLYETGTKNGVLYVTENDGSYGEGVAWNGLTGVTESPSGADETALYANDDKYLSMRAKEDFGGTITAYTYPDEWMECDGSKTLAVGVTVGQQTRRTFGLTYRTVVGNDVQGDAFGYKIHIVYGATASPSSRDYKTVNDSPEAIEFSWEFTTVPTNVTGAAGAVFNKTSHLEIDSTKLTSTSGKAALKSLEDMLYGTDAGSGTEGTSPTLPTPAQVYNLFKDVTAD